VGLQFAVRSLCSREEGGLPVLPGGAGQGTGCSAEEEAARGGHRWDPDPGVHPPPPWPEPSGDKAGWFPEEDPQLPCVSSSSGNVFGPYGNTFDSH